MEKNEIFDMPGIVSRKKQLIPYIGSVLREMQSDGVSPRNGGRSGAPFARADA